MTVRMEKWGKCPWLGSSVGYSIIPIYQGCGLDPWSRHLQEANNEDKNKGNNKSLLLPLPLSIKKKKINHPWLVWISGLSAGLWTKRLLVQFPVRAHAWGAGQVPSWGHARGNQWMYLSHIDVSLPPFPPKNK